MDRRAKILHSVNINGRGLELGPSYNPVVPKASGATIETLDHAPQAELVAKYASYGLDQVALQRIETVDHIWAGGSLIDAIPSAGSYDYIIASHFVEHMTDLVGFLQDCAGILNDSGVLSLVVPDKRFTFDRFKPLTSLGDVIDAVHSPLVFHPAGALVDHEAYAVFSHGSVAWSDGDQGPLALQNPDLSSVDDAERRGVAQDEYFDIHRWIFTPTSFRLLVEDLGRLGKHPFEIIDWSPTDGFEFFVTLGRAQNEPLRDRLERLLEVEREVAYLALGNPGKPGQTLEIENAELRAEIASLRASSSWRITKPLRAVAAWGRRRRP